MGPIQGQSQRFQFAVVYGYSDFGNTEWMAKPEFYFDSLANSRVYGIVTQHIPMV